MENAIFSPVPFAAFSEEAAKKGYKAVLYSSTGYYVKAKNGIRVEFQNTRGGVYGIGYTNPIPKVEAVYKALSANPPKGLEFLGRITRSFNYRATTLEAFFNLVEAVGAVKLPASVREINSASSPVDAPARIPYAGSEKKNPGRSIALDSPEGREATANAIAALENKAKKRA